MPSPGGQAADGDCLLKHGIGLEGKRQVSGLGIAVDPPELHGLRSHPQRGRQPGQPITGQGGIHHSMADFLTRHQKYRAFETKIGSEQERLPNRLGERQDVAEGPGGLQVVTNAAIRAGQQPIGLGQNDAGPALGAALFNSEIHRPVVVR